MQSTTQRGNILFLILLAVVLFAALSYAVTSSTRGGGNNASTESDKAAAAVMLQAASLIENTFNRMLLTGGFPDYGIELNYYFPYRNPNCGSTSCRLLDMAGGGLSTRILSLPTSYQNPASPLGAGQTQFKFMMSAVNGVGTSAPDLVLYAEVLSPGICKALNDMLGITATSVYNQNTPGSAFSPHNSVTPVGAWPSTTSQIGEEATATDLIGRRAACGCYQADCGNDYDTRFYYVVYAK